MLSEFKSKLDDRSAKVGVVGLGYVGMPLAAAFAKAGFKVTGVDVNQERVDNLNKGINHIPDVDDNKLKELVQSRQFHATTDFSEVKTLDALSVCVPTPLNKLKDPDVSYILSALEKLGPYLHHKMLFVLESTTYPGTTREMILPKIEELGFTIGEDFFLCFSPERIDPGNERYTVTNTPKVIGGITPNCTKAGQALYSAILETVVPVTSPEAAEMTKLLENTFRSINIGLVNEMAVMCEKLGVDVWEVIDAAATKPFGFMKFTPGPGLGGHCIPIDPFYLAWKMKTLDYRARFIELAGEINTGMPNHIYRMTMRSLNAVGKPVFNSNILIIGVAYKKDIDDVRESPALDVMQLLEDSGARISYYDPFVPKLIWKDGQIESIPDLSRDVLNRADAVVIITDHTSIDYELVRKNAALIIDTRNVYPLNGDKHIVRLGVGKK